MEDLLQTILDNPDDKEALRVYADALMEKGEPRGELITIQLRLEEEGLATDERDRFRVREKELIDTHAPTWLGPTLSKALFEGEEDSDCFAFVRGFLHTIDVYELGAQLVLGLRESEETRFLKRLIAEESAYIEEEIEIDGDELDEDSSIVGYLPWNKLTRLRDLHIGALTHDNGHFNGDDLRQRDLGQLKNLEELLVGALRASSSEVFGVSCPKLKKLHLHHIHAYDFATLARNPAMTNLEEIACRPHGLEPGDEGAYIRLSDLKQLLESKYIKKLKHLELRASDMGDPGVDLLLKSGLLGQLNVLDLHYGEITDEGAQRLAAHPDTKKLKKLDIGGNALTDVGLKALKDAGVEFVSDSQYQLNDDREYLWYGCPE